MYWTQWMSRGYGWPHSFLMFRGLRIRHGTNIDGRRRVYCEMKALVYTGIETLEMRDVADPNPGSDECVVRVESVGICGSGQYGQPEQDNFGPTVKSFQCSPERADLRRKSPFQNAIW